jgi:hypothetical protein
MKITGKRKKGNSTELKVRKKYTMKMAGENGEWKTNGGLASTLTLKNEISAL